MIWQKSLHCSTVVSIQLCFQRNEDLFVLTYISSAGVFLPPNIYHLFWVHIFTLTSLFLDLQIWCHRIFLAADTHYIKPSCAKCDYSRFTEKSHIHQFLPQFECLKEHKDKSLLSLYRLVICVLMKPKCSISFISNIYWTHSFN